MISLLAIAALIAPLEHRYDTEIVAACAAAAEVYAVPPALARAVVRQESAFRPRALSRVGARGLMQIMPATARALGFAPDEMWSPERNVLAGVRLLAVLLKHYRGDLISALVAYNARPRRLFAPLPRNHETPLYVLRALAYYDEYRRVAAGGVQ